MEGRGLEVRLLPEEAKRGWRGRRYFRTGNVGMFLLYWKFKGVLSLLLIGSV
jgi:hypothetical protein